MRKVLTTCAAVTTMLVWTAFAVEHEPSSSRDTIEFEGRKWRHDADARVSVKKYRGKTALHVRGARSHSSVYLPGIDFQNGTIEVDIAALDSTTPGIGFRGREKGYWCNRIMFNHWRGKDEDKHDVVEQAVVTRRMGTVLLLNIRRSGRDGNCGRRGLHDWYHVKLVVQGDTVSVYLNGSKQPSIELGAMLDGNTKGVLGLCGGGNGGFYFADFRYTHDQRVAPAASE